VPWSKDADSGKLNSIATRSERPIRDAIYAWSIEAQKRIDFRCPASARQQITNAAQIPLALFANCPNKQDRTLGADALRLNRLSERDQCSETTPIIRNPRCKQSVFALNDCEVSVA
jgi:hypothetical protein